MITATYDSNYEASVNALIRHAAAHADNQCKRIRETTRKLPGADGRDYLHYEWTVFFHEAMNRYAAAKGLRPDWSKYELDKDWKVVPRVV